MLRELDFLPFSLLYHKKFSDEFQRAHFNGHDTVDSSYLFLVTHNVPLLGIVKSPQMLGPLWRQIHLYQDLIKPPFKLLPRGHGTSERETHGRGGGGGGGLQVHNRSCSYSCSYSAARQAVGGAAWPVGRAGSGSTHVVVAVSGWRAQVHDVNERPAIVEVG